MIQFRCIRFQRNNQGEIYLSIEFRLDDIMTIMNTKKKVSNTELCDTLHCSLSTLRRDLIQLEKLELIKRIHGGVILNVTTNTEFPNLYREESNLAEKKMVAEIAQDFIGRNMCIFLDSSSTVQQLCPFIKHTSNLVVITNGLKTALELSEGENNFINVFIIGGEIKPNSSSVINDTYETMLNLFKFDLAIFSCRGIDRTGVYEASYSQAKVKKEMMERAKKSILLVDDSKFDSTHFFQIGSFKDYDAIITSKEPDDSYKKIFKENDVELLW
jgi:DeoR/GlpR family transcriptional regulator of sugar metabolism